MKKKLMLGLLAFALLLTGCGKQEDGTNPNYKCVI